MEWGDWSVKMGVPFCTCLLVFCGGCAWVLSYLCDSDCCFLEFRFFLDLYRYFSLGKREAWGLGVTELENLNEEGGELTFCYVGIIIWLYGSKITWE